MLGRASRTQSASVAPDPKPSNQSRPGISGSPRQKTSSITSLHVLLASSSTTPFAGDHGGGSSAERHCLVSSVCCSRDSFCIWQRRRGLKMRLLHIYLQQPSKPCSISEAGQ